MDPMGVAALGNAGARQRDDGVEGGKRRKNWQKEEMGVRVGRLVRGEYRKIRGFGTPLIRSSMLRLPTK